MASFYKIITNIAVITLIVAFGTAILWTWLVRLMITRPMNYVIQRIESIAEGEGDLTKRVNTKGSDEIGKLGSGINAFLGNFEGIISRVKATCSEVNTTAHEVNSRTEDLNHIIQGQASAIQQVAATIEQMAGSIKLSASHAETGHALTMELVKETTVTRESTKDLMKAMDEISQSSQRIGDIISTVNEVAFQTNLLALNAAVEAARAGEQGKGFAVVAEEVRSLAQRSADAARQIKTMIEDSAKKVKTGDDIVKRSVTSLKGIIGKIDVLSQTISEISASSKEQTAGAQEVSNAINQIEASTQHHASTVEELAAAANSLRHEAEDLNQTVDHFKVSEA